MNNQMTKKVTDLLSTMNIIMAFRTVFQVSWMVMMLIRVIDFKVLIHMIIISKVKTSWQPHKKRWFSKMLAVTEDQQDPLATQVATRGPLAMGTKKIWVKQKR
jgi:hypothetical protein